MKIQIMGAGALGSLVGYTIQKAGYDVIYVARGDQLRALQKRGLRVSGLLEDDLSVNARLKPVNADVTFVTVKSYDTENAAKLLAEVNCGIVCSLQNGIGNEEMLMKYIDNVVGGVTTYAANLIEPGHVQFAAKGKVWIGELSGEITENVLKVLDILKKSGMEAEAVKDIVCKIWEKVVINAAINPITALCRIRNGKIAEIDELWSIAKSIAEEGRELMAAMGFNIENIVGSVKEVIIKTANNKSSMLQDIEKGKKTEIDFINGAIAQKGLELGIDTTMNRLILNLVKGVEVANAKHAMA
jgi:2-dehydropantoate 2-reductase